MIVVSFFHFIKSLHEQRHFYFLITQSSFFLYFSSHLISLFFSIQSERHFYLSYKILCLRINVNLHALHIVKFMYEVHIQVAPSLAFTISIIHTVIRFFSISAKCGICTVLSLNGKLVEAKVHVQCLPSTYFCFNKCPI